MNMGYISDTARNRTHNLFRPKREPIPLGHSDEFWRDYVFYSFKYILIDLIVFFLVIDWNNCYFLLFYRAFICFYIALV